LVGIVSQLSILRGWKRLLVLNEPTTLRCSTTKALVFTGIFVPIYVFAFTHNIPYFSILTCFSGACIADRLYWITIQKKIATSTQLDHLRIGMVISLGISCLVFIANALYYGAH
jgi:hypothetical protein